MEKLCDVCHNGALVGDVDVADIGDLEQALLSVTYPQHFLTHRNAETLLGDLECERRVATSIGFVQVLVVDELWSVAVYNSAADCQFVLYNVNSQSETVLPAVLEVLHIDLAVRRRLPLAPQQQTVLRG